MRMKRSRVRTINICNKIVTKDSEGGTVISYDSPVTFHGEVWPASSQLAVEMYGDRINAIMNVRLRGQYTVEIENRIQNYVFGSVRIREGDGVCINTDSEPDYKIISIKPLRPLRMEVEKL